MKGERIMADFRNILYPILYSHNLKWIKILQYMLMLVYYYDGVHYLIPDRTRQFVCVRESSPCVCVCACVLQQMSRQTCKSSLSSSSCPSFNVNSAITLFLDVSLRMVCSFSAPAFCCTHTMDDYHHLCVCLGIIIVIILSSTSLHRSSTVCLIHHRRHHSSL